MRLGENSAFQFSVLSVIECGTSVLWGIAGLRRTVLIPVASEHWGIEWVLPVGFAASGLIHRVPFTQHFWSNYTKRFNAVRSLHAHG